MFAIMEVADTDNIIDETEEFTKNDIVQIARLFEILIAVDRRIKAEKLENSQNDNTNK